MTTKPQKIEGGKKIQVFIKCQGCQKELNRTVDLDSMELAEKIYFDALLNPMIGWCNDCDRKPFPFIEVDGKIIKKVKDTK
jgi:hypothetical protein